MKKKDLRELTGLSMASMAKLAKNQNVNTNVLLRICEALHCDLQDIAEVVDEEKKDIQFRKIKPQEARWPKGIAQRVIRHNYTSFLGSEAVNAFIGNGMSDKEIDDGLDRCTVMLSDNVIIGFAITNTNLLHLIMVDVPFQGKGYGGKLLAHVENEMFGRHQSIRLQTFKENTSTLAFYQKYGWMITEEECVPELGKSMLHLQKQKG